MRIVAFIEEPHVVRAILGHLLLWDAPVSGGNEAEHAWGYGCDMTSVKLKSPLKLATALIVLAAIVAEAIGMLIIHQTGTPHSVLVYLDSLLLVAILSPAIYLLVCRPMTMFIGEIIELNS